MSYHEYLHIHIYNYWFKNKLKTIAKPELCQKIANIRLLFQSNAPYWFKTPIPGPAPGPHMRRPGCNGAVCYCNDQVKRIK